MIYTKRAAFTLVELLVTISLMVIIMTASLVAFQSTRAVARDGKRKADLETVRSALELYRSDNGGYPLTGASWASGLVSGGYISAVPADSLTDRNYSYAGAGTCTATRCSAYTLCASVEIGGGTVSGCSSCGTATCNYKTTNP